MRQTLTGTMVGDLLSQVDQTLKRSAESIPTKTCRVCEKPKAVHHFSPAEWARDTRGQGQPVCRSCVKQANETRRGTGKGGSHRWMFGDKTGCAKT